MLKRIAYSQLRQPIYLNIISEGKLLKIISLSISFIINPQKVSF